MLTIRLSPAQVVEAIKEEVMHFRVNCLDVEATFNSIHSTVKERGVSLLILRSHINKLNYLNQTSLEAAIEETISHCQVDDKAEIDSGNTLG